MVRASGICPEGLGSIPSLVTFCILIVFSFFDEIIKHHLPEIEVNIDKEFEPCSEHPLHAPPPPESREMFDIDEWKVALQTVQHTDVRVF